MSYSFGSLCPDLTEKEANDLGLATMGICPECGKELMEKEITTNTDNMTSTITVGYCSCGFDISKNSKYIGNRRKTSNSSKRRPRRKKYPSNYDKFNF